MSFKCIADPANTEYRSMTIASQAYTIGDVVAYSRSAGTVIPATSSTTNNDLFAVAMETLASTATAMLCAIITPEQRWIATCTNVPNVANNFQRMVLTDARTVNNTGTDSTSDAAVVTQIGVINSTNLILVTFNKEAGVSL